MITIPLNTTRYICVANKERRYNEHVRNDDYFAGNQVSS